jgi:hypothetical protein
VSGQDHPSEPQHIPLETLLEWTRSDDPLLHHLAFHTAFAHPETVIGLTEEQRLEICLAFLEDALSSRYGESIPDGPYVLAPTVLAWLRRLSESDAAVDRAAIDAIVSLLERLAREGDDATRDVIVLGVLEHALEDDATRELFANWAADPELAPLYEEALRLIT